MADLTLTQLDYLPEGLLEVDASDLHTLLPGPTLLHLQGKQQRPLFVSVLLHGNEVTGLMAVQQLLKKYHQQIFPRPMSIFFGNIEAAKAGLRRLSGQPDYNRIWPGSDHPDCPEVRLMHQVWSVMRDRQVQLSVDIHNNTGRNPLYACINRLDCRFLNLAALFGHLVVYFLRPKGVQSMAFAELCPAVTLECGKPGISQGVDHALDFLDTCLHLESLSGKATGKGSIDLFHTVAQVRIGEQLSFSFNEQNADLVFRSDLDHLNFTELPAGIALSEVHCDTMPLIAIDEAGHDVTARFFEIKQGKLLLKQKVMPSMLTLDERIIRQDCLCYLMERLDETDIAAGPPSDNP